MVTSSQFVFHIGLPKTATTSFQQHLFGGDQLAPWRYLGVYQPRRREQTEFHRCLMRALGCPGAHFSTALESFQQIARSLEPDGKYLISEEMICVDTKHATWQEKFKRLGALTCLWSPTIFLTVRRPAEAAFSLYVQMRNQLRKSYPTFEHLVQYSNQVKIFDYQTSIQTLTNLFGQNSVEVVEFELIHRGRQAIDQWEDILNVAIAFDRLPEENRKKQSAGLVQTNHEDLANWARRYLSDGRSSVLKRGLRLAGRIAGSLKK